MRSFKGTGVTCLFKKDVIYKVQTVREGVLGIIDEGGDDRSFEDKQIEFLISVGYVKEIRVEMEENE